MGYSSDTPAFDDLTQLDALLTDTRATDTRSVSDIDEARDVIATFRDTDGSGSWNGLDRTEVADRLLDLVNNPRLIRQGYLNLCGPAALLVMWASRDPLGFANFATTLYDDGSADLGDLSIVPKDTLLAQDYSNLSTNTYGADWMLLSAIRNTDQPFWQSSWVGDPEQQLAALTRPEELASWLRATGIYAQVSDEGNWAAPAGIPHATGIEFREGRDVSLLINTNLLHDARRSAASIDERFLLNLFPNHYIVGLNNITVAVMDGPQNDDGTLKFHKDDVLLSIWSWGENSVDLAVPQQSFVDNYYGAVIADLP
ncbi:hypothetical protein QSH18_10240 [Xanthomonas sp. NCPPB 2654]|uniref:hypothetical protein n=1 Tax=unclassified Xanthomonas TaxID=2643310 RepID=UPI0021DF62E3|nr:MULTISPECIES: hypothetical protein [unclassified Xanthomonas]MDL5365983.1 hypothetical protein [Xanthomonas sp. NCPPB 2654]UYC22473.1 hypothetical protein NUG20_09400 [Xanthomonas sp. CFBP 8443]